MVIAKDLVSQKYISCEMTDRVSSLLGKMTRAKDCFALVFEKGKYKGVVSKDAFLVARGSAAEQRVANVVKKRSKSKTPFYVGKVKMSDSIERVCALLSAADARLLPVFEKTKLVGVIRAEDVLKEVRSSYAGVPAFELASMDAKTVLASDTLDTLLTVMKRKKAGHVPVVDEKGLIIGVVSGHDYMGKHLHDRRRMRVPQRASHGMFKGGAIDTGEKLNLGHIKVAEIMSTECCTATPRTSIRDVIKVMLDQGVFSVILTRRNKPVGVITSKDILSDAAKG